MTRRPDDAGGPRPGLGPAFFKGHGLGNDYLVFEAGDGWRASPAAVRAVCRRHRGVGADGIVAVTGRGDGTWTLRMFNPDGGEFERSGNGLRIFAAYLADRGEMGEGEAIRVRVGGDAVGLTLEGRAPGGALDVSVAMGRAAVGPESVGAARTRLDGRGRPVHPRLGPLDATLVSVGNPHCVLFADEPDRKTLEEVGRWLAESPAFPEGINLQVAAVEGPGTVRLLIWERGVGETSASGTSACAAAVAAVRRGAVEPGSVRAVMEGGDLEVRVSEALDVELRGTASGIYAGRLTDGFLAALARGVTSAPS